MAGTLALVTLIASSMQTTPGPREIAEVTQKTKTVCVGRFLIDVPIEAKVSLSLAFAGGLDLWTTDQESDQAFAARLRQAEDDMAVTMNQEGQPSLETSAVLVVGDGAGKTFVHNRRRRTRLKEQGYVTIENLAFLSMLRFQGLSITGKNDWVARDNIDPLSSILHRIRPLRYEEMPRQPGFCLEHAFIQDPYDHDDRESITMFAGFPGHPDVNLVLSSEAGVAPAPSLLARNASAAAREPVFMRLAFTHLRERQRTVNGMQGEELVMRVREPNLTTGYSFAWETRGRQDDVHAPVLSLELESGVNPVTGGKPVQSSLSEAALFDQWEPIVASIRLRLVDPLDATHEQGSSDRAAIDQRGSRRAYSPVDRAASGGAGRAVHAR